MQPHSMPFQTVWESDDLIRWSVVVVHRLAFTGLGAYYCRNYKSIVYIRPTQWAAQERGFSGPATTATTTFSIAQLLRGTRGHAAGFNDDKVRS